MTRNKKFSIVILFVVCINSLQIFANTSEDNTFCFYSPYTIQIDCLTLDVSDIYKDDSYHVIVDKISEKLKSYFLTSEVVSEAYKERYTKIYLENNLNIPIVSEVFLETYEEAEDLVNRTINNIQAYYIIKFYPIFFTLQYLQEKRLIETKLTWSISKAIDVELNNIRIELSVDLNIFDDLMKHVIFEIVTPIFNNIDNDKYLKLKIKNLNSRILYMRKIFSVFNYPLFTTQMWIKTLEFKKQYHFNNEQSFSQESMQNLLMLFNI